MSDDRQALTAAAEVMVLQTLDYAGARYRGKLQRSGRHTDDVLTGTPPFLTHTRMRVTPEWADRLVVDGRRRSLAQPVAQWHGADAARLQATVEVLTRSLLVEQRTLDSAARAELHRLIDSL